MKEIKYENIFKGLISLRAVPVSEECLGFAGKAPLAIKFKTTAGWSKHQNSRIFTNHIHAYKYKEIVADRLFELLQIWKQSFIKYLA